jgi:hypothetical protein
MRSLLRHGAALVAMLVFVAGAATAHDIPRDVTVQAFVKPEGQTLRVLARVPLRALSDVEYPRRERDFVDLGQIDQALQDAARLLVSDNLELREDDRLLGSPRIAATRMSLESDRSFASYEQALAHVTGPRLPEETSLYWEQGILDVLLEYPIESDHADFSVHAAFDRLALKVVTALDFLPPGGAARAYLLEGDAGLVHLDPRLMEATARFVKLGFLHILGGLDHLLFLLCLVIPCRRVRTLVPVITAFTVAHSITLIAAAFNYAPDALWFPPLIETLIAMSIVYLALENIVSARPGHRWIVTFLFGLVHGFGFSFGLQHTLQFAGTHLVSSLLAFNVGIELGQLLVIAICLPVLHVLFRHQKAERIGIIVLSVIVAHTAWHWMLDRFDVLKQFPWPTMTAAGLASATRWLLLLVVLAAAAWIISLLKRRTAQAASPDSTGR